MSEKQRRFGTILKNARIACDMTQEELAARADVSSRYIMKLENEGKEPSFEVLNKLVHALHVSADLFFYPENTPASSERTRLQLLLESCSDRDIHILLHTAQAMTDKK